MRYTFDDLDPTGLRHPDSYKWMQYPPDVLPLWVADMDFPVAPEILRALHARLDRPIGYPQLHGDPQLLDLLGAQLAAQGWPDVPHEGMWLLPAVVPGLFAAVMTLTAPGDGVLTHTPIYPPFLGAITQQGRAAQLAPLRQDPQGWQIDWEAMEAAVTPATRLFLLCSPHNPTGRVWSREELTRLAEFARRHRLWVVADELHADLTLDGEFVPFASVTADLAQRTVILTGPGKAFNTAGLGIGVAASPNSALIARLRAAQGLVAHPSALAIEMWRSALLHGRPWLEQLLPYLRSNRDLLTARLAGELPLVRYSPPQATYLAWLDFRAYSFADQAQAFMLEQARVGLNDGPSFGPDYQGFLRLNFATSRELLSRALDRMVGAVAGSSG